MIGGGRISGVGGLLGKFRQGAVLMVVLLLPAMSGCPLLWFALSPGDCGLILTIQGQVFDADAHTPVVNATVAVSVFKKGEQGDYVAVLLGSDTPEYALPSLEDGTFAVTFFTLGTCPPISYPSPDRIEVLVQRDTCETTYSIDVNDNTVIDLGTTDEGGASNHTLELTDPILVPPCEGETQP